MAEDSKSIRIATEAGSIRVCIELVLSMYKHVWDMYWVCNRDIKEGTQAVNGLDGFRGLTDTTILSNL